MANRVTFLLIVFMSTLGAQTNENGKCGTARHIRDSRSNRLDGITTGRPVLHQYVITPSGQFRIHFDTTGINTPSFLDENGSIVPNTNFWSFIDTLAIILDSVYIAEVETYQFRKPAVDADRGGGPEYDIYVMDMGAGWFGETVPEYDFPLNSGKSNTQYTSFIRIDNDFGFGYRTKGIAAVKVTCAHEFQHAIQVSGTGLWVSDFYFYELCAEAFEPLVFPDVKDYLFDVEKYYSNTTPIPLFSTGYPGYERAIFGFFLMKKYGTSIMRDLWEEMKTQRPIPALFSTLTSRMTTLETEYADFSEWNYFTGSRADSVHYFPDANIFPPLKFHFTKVAGSPVNSIQGNSKTFSTHFAEILHGAESTHFILTTASTEDLMTGIDKDYFFQIDYSSAPGSGMPEIRPDLFARFTAIPSSDLHYWKYRVQTMQGPFLTISNDCFPNPYNPERGKLFFTADAPSASGFELNIYGAGMDLVYSGPANLSFSSGKEFLSWNGRDNKGNIVSSGIYFYFLSTLKTSYKGKFAVIR